MTDVSSVPPQSADLLGESGTNRLVRARHGFMLFNRHDTVVGRSLAYYGEYFESEVRLFRQMVRSGDVVIDAGANIGTHTLALARATGPTGRVLAFEPVRLNHQLLCANMALNSLTQVECTAIAEVTNGRSLETVPSDLPQDWDDAVGVVHVRWRSIDRQRNAALLHREIDLHAADLLAAVHAPRKATRGRRAGAAVDHEGTRLGRVAAGQPPRAAQSVKQAPPQPEPGPAGE
ncbi:MAG TPA: FkbM family methyltransferase [Azospirillum sp.]|nr:FkbM family methyltransferase [Azospirillum sp.]